MYYRDRHEAGEKLAQALLSYQGQDVVVYALPRGGVVPGKAVAQALHAPLGLIITRKIGHPYNPEYAVCAIAEAGEMVCNEEERAAVDPDWLATAVERERAETERRRHRYLEGRPPLPATGKIAIIVDDGIATGLTMRAAIRQVRAQQPRQIVVAVPVMPKETAEVLSSEADAVVALDIPDTFLGAIGAYYARFEQVSDEEVVRVLNDPPLLFHVPLYDVLAHALHAQGLEPGAATVARYPNGEAHMTLQMPVTGTTCYVLATLMPPAEHLVDALLLCHTLKEAGAGRIVAVMPYLAYTRQDKDEPLCSRATAWTGALAHASGIEEVVTIDIHSPQAMARYPMPVISLSPKSVFARAIDAYGLHDVTLVAPDAGAVPRAEGVRQAAGITTPIASVQKERRADGIRAVLVSEVSQRAVIIDDMLDTGGTLIACCDVLQMAGVREITVMVTHGLFTGDRWHNLWKLGVTRICCTDTLPLPPQARDARICVLPVLPLLASYLAPGGGIHDRGNA